MARGRIGPLKNQHDHLCVEPQEMGAIFNEYFSLVFPEENIMGAKEIRERSCDVLDHMHITREEVSAALKCIKVDKSPGPDQVHL